MILLFIFYFRFCFYFCNIFFFFFFFFQAEDGIRDYKVTGVQTCALPISAVADLAELRLDYLRDLDFSSPSGLQLLLDRKPLPAIITCRSIEEGGNQKIDDDLRIPLLVEGARKLADYCDIEE